MNIQIHILCSIINLCSIPYFNNLNIRALNQISIKEGRMYYQNLPAQYQIFNFEISLNASNYMENLNSLLITIKIN